MFELELALVLFELELVLFLVAKLVSLEAPEVGER